MSKLVDSTGLPLTGPLLDSDDFGAMLDKPMAIIDTKGLRDDDGKPLQIHKVYAWIYTDNEGGEGVPAAFISGVPLPLIAFSERAARSLKPMARNLANQLGRPLTFVEFSVRTEIETIHP